MPPAVPLASLLESETALCEFQPTIPGPAGQRGAERNGSEQRQRQPDDQPRDGFGVHAGTVPRSPIGRNAADAFCGLISI